MSTAAMLCRIDLVLNFRGYGYLDSKCRLRVFLDQRDRRNFVAIITPVQGMSITIAADQIASMALPIIGETEDIRDRITWIEQHPKSGSLPETFSFVTFSNYDAYGKTFAINSWGKCFSGATWRTTNRAEVVDLIGGELA